MKRYFSFLLIATMLLGLLAACGGESATSTPASTDNTSSNTTATEAPAAATEEPAAATEEPAAATEEPAAATEEPTTGATTGGATGDITLWHAYSTGGGEDAALTALIEQAKKDNPDATINVLQVPFSDIFSKFENEVSAGGGPDLLLAPNDSLGNQARKGLLMPLDDLLAGKLDNIGETAVNGMKVDGVLYGVPESYKAVALYYNKSTVDKVPTTTDELLQAVKDGKTLVINQNIYHNYGFLQAFGGKLFDADNKCAATTGGPEMIKYLQDLKAAGATFVTDGGQGDALFREGKADMIINGPWVLADFEAALGDKLGVAPMPAGPGGPAGPLTGVDGFYVNANSQNPEGAVALALYLTNEQSQQMFTDKAGHVPTNTTVTSSDPNVAGFAEAASTGVPRPQSAELDNFWTPFGDAVTKAVEGGEDATAVITEACQTMDTANNK